MRLLLSLKSADNIGYEANYQYHIQSLIYTLLEGSTQFSHLHDKKGYKFFCFSNIFSPSRLNENKEDIRHIIISSPSRPLIGHLASMLVKKKEQKDPITVGKKQLFIEDIRSFETRLRPPFTLITGTPIIMRISRERYLKYDIETKYPYAYVYWRKEHPLEMFTRQLEENLCAKYAEFTGKEIIDGPIIQKLTFRKQISTRIFLHDKELTVIGTLWEFSFDNELHTEILQFGLDCGLGERNSMGFGFMNLQR
jgi:CRISPR-associated endoribonuclease Cas6